MTDFKLNKSARRNIEEQTKRELEPQWSAAAKTIIDSHITEPFNEAVENILTDFKSKGIKANRRNIEAQVRRQQQA